MNSTKKIKMISPRLIWILVGFQSIFYWVPFLKEWKFLGHVFGLIVVIICIIGFIKAHIEIGRSMKELAKADRAFDELIKDLTHKLKLAKESKSEHP